MINLNEIAFIDSDGFDYNDGEELIRFDAVAFYPDKKIVTFAVTKQGQISVLDYEIFEDETVVISNTATLIKKFISIKRRVANNGYH